VSKGLKTGQTIVIPSKSTESEPLKQEVAQVAEPIVAEVANVEVPQTETQQVPSEQDVLQLVFDQILSDLRLKSNQPFRTLLPGSRAEVALLLPFGSEEKPSQNYLDFYRGFLMGLDSVRMSGHSINLNIFNTAHNHERVETIINSGALHQADLVVGPIYEDELLPVATALQQRGTPIVSPLANLTQTSAPTVFQMSPPPSTKYDKVRGLFDGSKRVLIISASGVDHEFDAEVRSMLKEGAKVVEHKYIYEHPSVIEKRADERAANGTYSPSDMTPLLRGKEPTVIVITANNEVDVDRILTALASANISLTARSQRVVPFVVFGNNRWNRYRNIDKSLYFTNNVTMLSTYHARRSDAKIRNFDKRFVEEYSTLPSLYAYRGYDAAVLFVSALYGGLDVGLEGMLSMPLLTPYIFESDAATGVRKNNQWVKVNYNSDFTITTE
jgi:ABC-type branched-subunit amino acid transport system substrate-binding protein